MTLDSATWAALALTLTLVGALLTVLAWRRRGAAAGVRGLAWTLVPVAAWLTGTLRLATDVAEAVVRWVARLAFSPTVWLGLVVAGTSAALFVLAAIMRARGIGVRRTASGSARGEVGAGPGASGGAGKGGRPRVDTDEDMADIEAILRRHGL